MRDPGNAEKSAIRRITGIVLWGVVIVAVLLALFILSAKLMGGGVYSILSGSMEPELRTGSLVYVLPVGAEELEVGVPIELGNEYQDALSYVNWQFQAEVEDEKEKGTPSDEEENDSGEEESGDGSISDVKTGDKSDILIWLMTFVGAGIACVSILKKRER